MKRRTKISLWMLAAAVALFLIVRFVATPYIVVGDSMVPTLKSWDVCLMARVRQYQPQRGQIVIFRTSDDPPLYFVKRVIGLPGETVAIEDGVVKVNGKPLDESYAEINPAWEMEPTGVPGKKVFVLGDNRRVELEETLHGLVATRLVKARMLWRWRWRR
jgi:signal peptidase I